MAIRKDSYTGYYPIKYTITFRLSSEGDLHTEEGTFYVHITVSYTHLDVYKRQL